ncbi:hypothetical protein [Mycobacteroides abscessus]|uniref:hypothetical protein n=1 Tax=Mycobacteroides abscessus TaxID=36809 RepID=UPI00130004EA|nr:hypothetical protein [Mycobacteroides abscessus]
MSGLPIASGFSTPRCSAASSISGSNFRELHTVQMPVLSTYVVHHPHGPVGPSHAAYSVQPQVLHILGYAHSIRVITESGRTPR